MQKETKTLISVIIPAYNSQRYIKETIISAMNQTEKNIEIIVVDDGSTDDQKYHILSLSSEDSRIRYIYQENSGVSSARNYGYKLSTGRFIAFLDSDDVWLPENLEEKVNKFKLGDFGLVHSDAFLINEGSDRINGTLCGKEGLLLNGFLEWKETQIPGPSSILIKREVLDAVGLFDTNISTSADMDFFIRVASKYSIGRVDKVTWKYRVHGESMSKNIFLMERDVIYVFEKARRNGLFYDQNFQKECISNMYLILAASWFGDGGSFSRAFYFMTKAIAKDFTLFYKIPKRLIHKWVRSY